MADETFSADERAAMKELAAERRRAKGTKGAAKLEADRKAVDDAIAAMSDADRALAETIHEIIENVAPDLDPKTWYGMPAYAREGKVIVFFKPADKFKVRYAELGFNEFAALDDGPMWGTAFAVTSIGDEEVARIRDLVAKAAA